MSCPVKLAVVHQSHLFCQCLGVVFGEAFDVLELSHEQPLQEMLAKIETESPRIVVIDLGLPGELALEVAHFVKQGELDAKIVVIVTTETQERLADYVVAGADAWVHQESSLDELRTAVRDVLDGQTFCAAGLLPQFVSQFADVVRNTSWRETADTVSLTPRELEILELVSDRLSNKQIARRLSISLYTVKNHVHSILEKLDVESRFSAVDYARQKRWLSSVRQR